MSKLGSNTGKVKFFNETKKFGFITPDNGGKDVFFHVTGIVSDDKHAREGQRCSFEIEQDAKGLRAANVELL